MSLTLRVGHLDYAVVPMPVPQRAHDRGECNLAERVIRIDPTKQPAEQAEILIRELLHALWDTAGLPPRPREERAVLALAQGLAAVLRDNPWLYDAIYVALNRGGRIVRDET